METVNGGGASEQLVVAVEYNRIGPRNTSVKRRGGGGDYGGEMGLFG